MDEPVKINNGEKNANFVEENVVVEFKEGIFSYPSKPSVNVLKGINLKIYKG